MIWILDCEELITLACWPQPLVRLDCLLVHYLPSKSIFDDDFDDLGLFARPANPSPPQQCNGATRFLQVTTDLLGTSVCLLAFDALLSTARHIGFDIKVNVISRFLCHAIEILLMTTTISD